MRLAPFPYDWTQDVPFEVWREEAIKLGEKKWGKDETQDSKAG